MFQQVYCDRCGGIWNWVPGTVRPCSICGNVMKEIPDNFKIDYLNNSSKQIDRVRKELVMTSNNFDQYFFDNRDKIKREKEALSRERETNRPKCPTCGSFSICKVSEDVRVRSDFFGGFIMNKRVGKTFECKNCGYLW